MPIAVPVSYTHLDVYKRQRALRADHSAWRSAQDTGQFSLAGAQPKTALLFERKRWGVPSGRVPTTHILKPVSYTHLGCTGPGNAGGYCSLVAGFDDRTDGGAAGDKECLDGGRRQSGVPSTGCCELARQG